MAIFTSFWSAITDIFAGSGISSIFHGDWRNAIMIVVACGLLYLGIAKKFEPLLMIPIAFGMLLANLPGAGMAVQYHDLQGFVELVKAGQTNMIDWLYLGVKAGIFPPLIFIGIGAMTDFSPLIARPSSFILGAAAQFGIFGAFLLATVLGFSANEAGSIGIIGGADGPTAILTTSILAPELLGPIAVAAYSYMALIPVIQPPIMKLLTTKKERSVVMTSLRPVSQTEKILFPILVTIVVALVLPSAAVLVGCLMLGNLLKESKVAERLTKAVQNEMMNIVTVCLGLSVGATTNGKTFLTFGTIKIVALGLLAFMLATAAGVLFGKLMYVVTKGKINPLIGSAGVSAVPMAARVSQKVGQEENPQNFLLMHAMGPNVAGVIGSAVAAGVLITMIPH